MLTNLTTEEARKLIKGLLEKKGCIDVSFPDLKDDIIVTTFNCKELTSFNQPIRGWVYSGIQLDPSRQRQYKIDFKKIAPINP